MKKKSSPKPTKCTLILRKAAATNARRDEMEHKVGLASPTSGGNQALIDTAIIALVAGINMEDWDAVAEALDMLLTTTYGQHQSKRIRHECESH